MQPNLALEGELPHVIDEWQDVPRIWDAVRRRVDETGNQCGQYLLTGSSTVDKSKIGHSGAGRIAKVHMRPMSLYESGTSDGRISLKDLFEGKFETSQVQTDLRDIARFICAGGWPVALGRNDDIAGDLPAQYLDATFSVSAPRCGLDPYETRKVAGSLARNLGKTLTYRVLYADVYAEEPPRDADNSALRQRLLPFNNFFKDQYFIEEQSGWDAPVKSRSRVRSKPKHTFADPSLPASLLAMTPERLLFERQLFGNLFEELCLRDIRVYTSAMGFTPDPEVRYYSDADGLEIDIVIELPD